MRCLILFSSKRGGRRRRAAYLRYVILLGWGENGLFGRCRGAGSCMQISHARTHACVRVFSVAVTVDKEAGACAEYVDLCMLCDAGVRVQSTCVHAASSRKILDDGKEAGNGANENLDDGSK